MHQFSADYAANPNSTKIKQILTEIDPEIKERLPKWLARKQILAQEAVVEAVRQAWAASQTPDETPSIVLPQDLREGITGRLIADRRAL